MSGAHLRALRLLPHRWRQAGLANPVPQEPQPIRFPALPGLLEAENLYQVFSVSQEVESLESANQQQSTTGLWL